MTDLEKFTIISCEQAYNLWITDPDLIGIIDLRGPEEYREGHIPGSRLVLEEVLERTLEALEGHKLAILLASDRQKARLARRLSPTRDIVFLDKCERWPSLGYPVVVRGQALPPSPPQQASIEPDNGIKGASMNTQPIFYQLFEPETSTYTYLLADPESKEAALIDPVLETVDRDLKLINELGLKLVYVLDTHVHADHVTGAGEIRGRTAVKTGVSAQARVECADIPLEDGQELLLGKRKIRVIATPGHTDSCLSYYFEGMVFTGDSLLIRGTGRTDFQQGSSSKLYDSVTSKLFTLPAETKVYPGHDYRGQTASTIELEKLHNPRIGGGITKEEFTRIMSDLKLANPKKIHEAVPANLACGRSAAGKTLHPQVVDGIPEVTPEEVKRILGRVRIVDVRMPSEFNNELGHIEGSELTTLGPDFTAFLERGDRSQEIVFVCRSGHRSGQATAQAMQMGYKSVANMAGGMIRWNEIKEGAQWNKIG